MIRPSLFSILAALVLLGGCRARQDQQPATRVEQIDADPTASTAPSSGPIAHPAATPTSDTRPLLVCFGDSLTAGFGTNPGQSYPDFLQEDLDRDGYKYRVVNEGVSGATSKDGVLRLPAIIRLHPYAVIVEFGGNDGLRGLPVPAMRANLDRIVAGLKASGAKILIAGIILPPDYGPDYVNQFIASYPALGAKYQAPVYPFLLKDVYGVQGMMQHDNIHATAQGNQIVAKNLVPAIEALLKK